MRLIPMSQKVQLLAKTLRECVEQFETKPIFDGLTIYNAESEIEVLFG